MHIWRIDGIICGTGMAPDAGPRSLSICSQGPDRDHPPDPDEAISKAMGSGWCWLEVNDYSYQAEMPDAWEVGASRPDSMAQVVDLLRRRKR